jgi:hypothetical protein
LGNFGIFGTCDALWFTKVKKEKRNAWRSARLGKILINVFFVAMGRSINLGILSIIVHVLPIQAFN